MQESVLNWPEWAERTSAHERSAPSKFDKKWNQTKSDLASLFENMGVEKWNIDHVTGSHGDPGVVVRWVEDGTDYAVACDDYTSKGGNLREAFLWIKFERRQGNRPVKTGQDQFAAAELPSGGGTEAVALSSDTAYDILGVSQDASDAKVKQAYQRKVKAAHPDNGGSPERLKRVREARDTILGD